MKHLIMDLSLFDTEPGNQNQGGQNNGGNNGGNSGGNTTYTYEQLEEIARTRTERAERAALNNFFTQNGMTAEEATAAFNAYKEQKEKNKPNVSQIEQERDEARAELEKYKNQTTLDSLGVQSEYKDFVAFEVQKKVTDKVNFKQAAEAYKKEHPSYFGGGYRVKGSVGTGNEGSSENNNNSINDMIRRRART